MMDAAATLGINTKIRTVTQWVLLAVCTTIASVSMYHLLDELVFRPSTDSLTEKANSQFQDGEYKSAIGTYRKLLKEYPDWVGGWIRVGQAYHELEKFNQAVNAYQQATHINPDKAPAYGHLGDTYFSMGEYWKSSEVYKRYIHLNPDDNWKAMFLAHDLLFDFDRAFALNQQILARNPDSPSALANLAEACFTTGRHEEYDQRVTALLVSGHLDASTEVALRAIDIANMLALGKTGEARHKLNQLTQFIEMQHKDFQTRWRFRGVKHHISHREQLKPYRQELIALFDSLENDNRDKILSSVNHFTID